VDRIKSIAVPVTRRSAIAKSRQSRGEASKADDRTGLPVEFRREPMPTTPRPVHRYRVGQRLVMARGSRDIARAASMCQVVAILPHENGPLLYRVRSDNESYERIVDEIDLAPLR
jgi:hypothetical protein